MNITININDFTPNELQTRILNDEFAILERTPRRSGKTTASIFAVIKNSLEKSNTTTFIDNSDFTGSYYFNKLIETLEKYNLPYKHRVTTKEIEFYNGSIIKLGSKHRGYTVDILVSNTEDTYLRPKRYYPL